MNRGDYVTIIEIIRTKFGVIFDQNNTFYMNEIQNLSYTGGTLSAKLFRAKFNHPKVQLAQNSVL